MKGFYIRGDCGYHFTQTHQTKYTTKIIIIIITIGPLIQEHAVPECM